MRHSGYPAHFKNIALFILAVSLAFSGVTIAAGMAEAASKAAKKPKNEAVLSNYEMYQLGANEIVFGLSGKLMPLPKVEFYDENEENNNGVGPNEVRITLANTRLITRDMTDHSNVTPMVPAISLEQVSSDIVISVSTSEPMKLRMLRGTAPANEYMIRFISVRQGNRERESSVVLQQQPLPPKQPTPFDSKEKISLSLRDTELRDVFRLMGTYLKKNIIIDPSLPTTLVTLSMSDVPMNEVFEYLADTYDLAWRMIGDKTIIVGTKSGLRVSKKEETRAFRLAYADPSAVQTLLAGLTRVAAEKITIDSRMRTLYVRATPEKLIEVSNALQELDKPGRQIMIQAKIFEFSDGATKDVQTALNAIYDHWWLNYSGSGGLRSGYADDNQFGRNLSWRNEDSQILPLQTDLKTPLHGLWREFDVAFQAVENKNLGKTLANPSVITIDGQEAKVTMTEDYPYISERDEAGNPTWSQKNVGPTLSFTPQIGRDEMISLKLTISTGEVIEMITGSTGEQMPRTSTRTVDTNVRVRNGEPFVVGGLFRDTKTTSRVRVPILGQIPLLGELFTYRNDVHRKTQVVMLVVPFILDVPDVPVEQKMLIVQPD